MVHVWVAGKTVWSPCYTRAVSDFYHCCHARQLIRPIIVVLCCSWAVCLNSIKGSLLLLLSTVHVLFETFPVGILFK